MKLLSCSWKNNFEGKNLSNFILYPKLPGQPQRTFRMNLVKNSTEPPETMMDRTQQYKFVLFKANRENVNKFIVLLDMFNDAHETENLAYNPSYKQVAQNETEAKTRF
ncbi:MAG: hypothetical protein L3J11_09740 [Draconibacterium sp.]|nr:hypothetical protein [Draconibacterium sp.]